MELKKTHNQLSSFLKSGSMLSIIIISCIALWVLTLLFPIVDYLYTMPNGTARSGWFKWLSLSSEWTDLLHRPWTIITYMFLHDGLWHILFNMLMLYFGGILCCQYLGQKRFGFIYFISGIAGAFFYLLVYNLFPIGSLQTSSLIGASAAVLGVFVAVAVYVPNQEVSIWPFKNAHIKLKFIILALVIIDLLTIPSSNAGGHIAHLGGALTGWIYIIFMRANISNILKKKPFQKKAPKTNNRRPLSDDEYNRRRAADQKRIDEILDKISRSGYEKLTREEKEILFKYK